MAQLKNLIYEKMPTTINNHMKMLQNSPEDKLDMYFYGAKPNGELDENCIIKSGSDVSKVLLK